MKKILIFLLLISYFPLTNGNYYYDYQSYDKVIRVNTFFEKLSYYELGEKIGEFSVSTGDFDNQTPTGRFQIMTKAPIMLSKSAGKWMPYWMEFYQGTYGIHGLPEKYNGEKYSTEEESIGFEAAGGCVRVGEENLIKLYNWAELGTTVLISYDKEEYKEKPKTNEEILNEYIYFIEDNNYVQSFNLIKYKKYKFSLYKKLYSTLNIKYGKLEKITESKYISDIKFDIDGRIIEGFKYEFIILNGEILKTSIKKNERN